LVALRCRPLHRGRHPVPTRRSSDYPRRYRPATIGAGDCERIVPYNDAGIPWTRWCVEMSFTLGGKTARELGLVMLRESQRPILPGTMDKTMHIPGRHGAWDFGAELDARVFELECAFVTKNRVELQRRITALAAHLVDSYGRPRKLELRF